MSPEAQHIIDLARRVRLPLHDEKAAQQAFSDFLIEHDIEHLREVRLGKSGIVDFMIGSLAIEMKLKGSRMEFYRQVDRYTQHERVSELILLTARSAVLPTEINGKPVHAIHMSLAFL